MDQIESMDGWKSEELDKVCIKISDRDHTTPTYVKEGVPIISPRDFIEDSVDFANCKKISRIDHEKNVRRTDIKDGDLLFSRIGTIGEVRLVNFNREFSVLHSIVQIRSNENKVLTKYLFYYLKSGHIQNQCKSGTQSIGTPDLGIKKIRSFLISYPIDKRIQEKIVKKLDYVFGQLKEKKAEILQLQEKIINNHNSQLIKIKNEILYSAFTGKLTPKHESSINLIKTIGKLKNDPSLISKKIIGYFSIPEEWTWLTLNDVIESMKNGIYKPSNFYGPGVKCLRMYNILDGKIVLNNVKEMILTNNEIIEYGLHEDDILLNRVNSRELVAKSAVIPRNLGDMVFESKNIRVRVLKGLINPHYVNYYLQTEFMRNLIETTCKKTAGMATVSQEDIKKWLIPIPSHKEQNEVVSHINKKLESFESVKQTMSELINKNKALEQNLANLTPSILSKAFSGKLVN